MGEGGLFNINKLFHETNLKYPPYLLFIGDDLEHFAGCNEA